ncbi:hypothetical protein GCM10020001_034940 [Nonomuraea salmonea]
MDASGMGALSTTQAPSATVTTGPKKVARNRARDADTDQRLRRAGWVPIRIWEHEDPNAAALKIQALVRARRTQNPSNQRVASEMRGKVDERSLLC